MSHGTKGVFSLKGRLKNNKSQTNNKQGILNFFEIRNSKAGNPATEKTGGN